MLEPTFGSRLFAVLGDWLVVSGCVGFVAMGLDKARAVSHEWRVAEKTLFIIALSGGSLGMVVGSWIFHHKTSKASFLMVLYSIVIVWILALQRIGFLVWLASIIPHLLGQVT